MGPCPAQTFCICENLALFPFSWAASSSLTAGLKETQRSTVSEGQAVTGRAVTGTVPGSHSHLSSSSNSSLTVMADTMVMV